MHGRGIDVEHEGTKMMDYALKHTIVAAIFLCSLAGCNPESIEGTYLPSCRAYAGDSIALQDGIFEWDKFSDEVVVDEDGNKIDRVPQHPVKGRYVIEGQQLVFSSDSGIVPEFSFWLRSGQEVYLLTAGEYEIWQNSSALPECALVLRDSSSK
jgi:hypothetical protein